MKLIPVIDVMNGLVVRAYRGERKRYAPLSTRLCPDSDPVALARRFRTEYGIDTLYVADLDAITGDDDNLSILRTIARAVPEIELWIDAGIGDREAFSRYLRDYPGRPVIGSETLVDPALPTVDTAAILSLDYLGAELLGAADPLASLGPTPRDAILMSLHRIGTGSGPDFDLLATARSRFPALRLYAAGGVRDTADLARLKQTGAAGVLLASALHDGRINSKDATLFTS